MARLAISIAGGIIGSFFGMPQLGFLVGSVLGSIIDPQKAAVGGPRVTDLKVTSSTYGSPIPEGYGTGRLGGNIIWADDMKEHKHSQGKGGGGPSSYTYTWTGGVAICAGPIADVTRIWADSKLVFDKTGETSAKTLNRYKIKFRLYKGTEDQLPDPALEAKVGVGNATAHRGIAHVVFDDIPLADYGNRVPNWNFEVAFGDVAAVQPAHAITFSPGLSTPAAETAVIDWPADRAFFFSEGTSADDGITACDLVTGQPENFVSFSSLGVSEVVAKGAVIGVDGFIYMAGGNSNNDAIYKIDPDGLTVVGSFGPATVEAPFPGVYRDGFTSPAQMIPLQVGGNNYMFCTMRGTTLGTDIGVFNTDSMGVTAPDAFTQAGSLWSVYACPGVQIDEGSGGVYGMEVDLLPAATPINILQWDVDGRGDVSRTVMTTVAPTDILADWANFNAVCGPWYDSSDGNIIIGLSTSSTISGGESQHYIVKLASADGAILWKTRVNSIPVSAQTASQSSITNGTLCFVGNTGDSFSGAGDASASGYCALYTINTADGGISRSNWPFNVSVPSAQIWDETTGSILLHGQMSGIDSDSDTWMLIYADRVAGQAVDLSGVVSDICALVDLPSGDIDVTELVGTNVEGYVISTVQTAKDSLAPLAFAFQFDCVESDDKLKFVKRGGSSLATIPNTDLAVIDTKNNSVSQETRTQEVDLPSQISLQFFDPDHDYQQATQYMRRSFAPFPTMRSSNAQSISLPIVMSPLFAKQLCETTLFSSWVNRVAYKVQVPWQYAKYDPTDNLTLTLTDDSSVLVRLVETNFGADLTLDLQVVAEDSAAYTAGTTDAAGGDGFLGQVIVGPSKSRLFLLDSPLLRDLDDQGRSFSVLYFAAGGYTNPFQGMELYRSADTSAYADVGGVTQSASWGTCTTVLGDTDTPFGVDYVNTLTVTMTEGGDNLSSATLTEVCNGANAAIVYNRTSGILEVIQFQTVVQNSDGSYTLSGLVRGRRGTEIYTGSHDVGEGFILLSDGSATIDGGVSNIGMGLGDLNVIRYFKGVTNGTLLENALRVSFTDTGRSLKPYAPVEQAAAMAGSDIALAWERRTRVGGEWLDLSGTVPLSEDAEKYEVDIYDAPGTSVLRTLTSTTTSVTYLAADITTDFGGSLDTLTIAVYQISAQVGRGFTKKVALDLGATWSPTYRYFGASALTSLAEEDIVALSNSDLTEDFDLTFSYDCTGGAYPYFCFPESYGTPAAVKVNGLPFSDFTVTVVAVGGVDYNVLKFNNIQTGAAIPVVWA